MAARTPGSWRPTARTISPVRNAGAGVSAGAGAVPTRRTAMSVSGSRPTSSAEARLPSGRMTGMSSSRRTEWSAVTMTPGFHRKPLEPIRWRASMATADWPARSTRSARLVEKLLRTCSMLRSWLAGRESASPERAGGDPGNWSRWAGSAIGMEDRKARDRGSSRSQQGPRRSRSSQPVRPSRFSWIRSSAKK
jgi:hypothetical protein